MASWRWLIDWQEKRRVGMVARFYGATCRVLFRNVIACVIDPQGLKGLNICRSRNKFW